jgi:hypothetical protein
MADKPQQGSQPAAAPGGAKPPTYEPKERT